MPEVHARAAGYRCRARAPRLAGSCRRRRSRPPARSRRSGRPRRLPARDLRVVGEAEGGRLVGQQPDLDVVPAQRVDQLARHVARLAPDPGARAGARGAGRSRFHLLIRRPRRDRPTPQPRSRAARSPPGPRRSHRKNSTLPDGPGSGLTVTARAPQPRSAAASATVATASARSAGSRTTPPLPTRCLPTSNCGFTIGTRSPSSAGHADQRVEHQRERDEGEVADDQVDRPADRSPGRGRGRSCGRAPRTRSSCRSRQASWP